MLAGNSTPRGQHPIHGKNHVGLNHGGDPQGSAPTFFLENPCMTFDQLAEAKQWLQCVKHRLKTDKKYRYRGVGSTKFRAMRKVKPPSPEQRANWDAVATCIELLDDIRRETLNQKSDWFITA
jgi:hypothetical protein